MEGSVGHRCSKHWRQGEIRKKRYIDTEKQATTTDKLNGMNGKGHSEKRNHNWNGQTAVDADPKAKWNEILTATANWPQEGDEHLVIAKFIARLDRQADNET